MIPHPKAQQRDLLKAQGPGYAQLRCTGAFGRSANRGDTPTFYHPDSGKIQGRKSVNRGTIQGMKVLRLVVIVGLMGGSYACGAAGGDDSAYVACSVTCGDQTNVDGRSYDECVNPPEGDGEGESCTFKPLYVPLPPKARGK